MGSLAVSWPVFPLPLVESEHRGSRRTRPATRRGEEREELHFPTSHYLTRGFPGGAAAKNLPAKTGDAGDVGLIPGSYSREDPLEKEMATTPVFLLENSMDRGAWRTTVPAIRKS